jgi:Dimerisation domain of d-ornithine 4,5-aminomutase
MSQMGTQGVVRPYGDTTGDGRVQVSFTLPVPFGDEAERALAEGAALQLAGKMGLDPAMVVHAKGMGPDFTFFIVYGRVGHLVDLSAVTVAEREFLVLPAAEVNLRIRSALGRKLVVVGACIGTDAHTVGIDAILNVKGHAARVVCRAGPARGDSAATVLAEPIVVVTATGTVVCRRPRPSRPLSIGLRCHCTEGGGEHAEVQVPGPGDALRGR